MPTKMGGRLGPTTYYYQIYWLQARGGKLGNSGHWQVKVHAVMVWLVLLNLTVNAHFISLENNKKIIQTTCTSSTVGAKALLVYLKNCSKCAWKYNIKL